MPIDNDELVRDALFHPTEGISARMLVLELQAEQINAKLDSIEFALNGDSQTKGITTIVRELDDIRVGRDGRRKWLIRDILVGGVVVAVVLKLIEYGFTLMGA